MSSDSKQKKNASPAGASETSDYDSRDWTFALVHGLSGLAVVCTASYLAFNDRLSILQPKDRQTVLQSLSTFSGKLEFTSKYWVLPAAWLLFNLHIVMNNRLGAKATNPLVAGNDHKIQRAKNILSNTIEQTLLAILLQTASLHYLSPVQVMNLAPLFNAFFLVGRIAFWIGYPKRRSLGFSMNIGSSMIMTLFTIYHFVVNQLDLNCDSLFQLRI